ncbi:MAG: hypothetical protein BGO54_02390 [Sphingobacteriales bacterium 46-32]|nr:MAG: hypothetical protein BGO54_02390 [Sphingobacteriales bacterium 46-32]
MIAEDDHSFTSKLIKYGRMKFVGNTAKPDGNTSTGLYRNSQRKIQFPAVYNDATMEVAK